MTLDEAIAQLVSVGIRDPLTIARKLEEQYGDEWVTAELVARAEDILTEYARRYVSAERRSNVVALRTRDIRAQSEIMTKYLWYPGEHGYTEWKRIADFTAEDWDRRAAFMEQQAVGVLKGAMWCRQNAKLVRDAGVETTGQLTVDLPPLPDAGDLELPALPPAETQ